MEREPLRGSERLALPVREEAPPAGAWNPLISVVIPTLNAETLIGTCLRSVTNQTYREIEVIVVDGLSKDRTVEIAQQYTPHVYRYGPDQSKGRVYGGPYQRNYGAARARGDYIYLVDADMELTPKVLEACVDTMRRTGADTLIIPEEFHGTTFWARCKWLEKRCYRGDDTMEAPRLIKKTLWNAIGGVDPTMGGVEDRHMFRKLLAQGARIARTREIVWNNEGRLTLRGSWRKKYLYGKSALQYLRQAPTREAYREFTIFKAAYLHHWRLLSSHPLLTFGLLLLRSGEYVSVALGMLQSILSPRAPTTVILREEPTEVPAGVPAVPDRIFHA